MKKLNASAAAIFQELLPSSPAEKCKSEGGMKEEQVNEGSDTEYESEEDGNLEETYCREMLCFRCFMEHAQHAGDVNVKTLTMPSISLYLEQSVVWISDCSSPLDLLALSYVVRSHQHDVRNVQIDISEEHCTDRNSPEQAIAASIHDGGDFNADLQSTDFHGDLSSVGSTFTGVLTELICCSHIEKFILVNGQDFETPVSPFHSVLLTNVIRKSASSLDTVKIHIKVYPAVISSLAFCQDLKFLSFSFPTSDDYLCLATAMQKLGKLERLVIGLTGLDNSSVRPMFQSLSGKDFLWSLTLNSFPFCHLHHLTTAITILPALKKLVFQWTDFHDMTVDQENAFVCAIHKCPELRFVEANFGYRGPERDMLLLQQSSYPDYITLTVLM